MDSNTIFFVVSYQQFGLDINVVTKIVNMSTVKSTKASRIASMAAAIPASRSLTSTPNNSNIWYTGTTTGSTNISWNPPHSNVDNLTEYIDLLYSIVGVDINFEGFCKMSESEKKSFVREIKIEKIINKDDYSRS